MTEQGLYSTAVLEHFKNPRHAGELEGATASVQVENPVCGDVMKLAVRVENGCIAAARFQTQGCVTAIACGSWLTEWMHARRVDELAALTPEQVAAALGGLSPATQHGAQLAADSLRALLENLER